jgi:ABC-2 type transport system ATP-binding protein
VFITTHYLGEADALCDRLAIIDPGRIVAEGTAEELKRDVAGDVVTVGVGEDVAEALRLLEHQPFVREATIDEGTVRLYVERGGRHAPDPPPARRRRNDPADHLAGAAVARRRVPAPDGPVAP